MLIRAGASAQRVLFERGFNRDDFSCLVGASGGPKWLVLSHIDRVLCETFLSQRSTTLHMLGASIGSFRHACFAQRNPLAAIERFEQAYIEQSYETAPTAAEVSAESRRILDIVLRDSGAHEILANDTLRSNIVTVRSRKATAGDHRLPLSLGLGAAAVCNALNRSLLAGFFQRAVFSSHGASFVFRDFATIDFRLTPASVAEALMASGSIPLLMQSVRDIPGALPGSYRDGGVIDYHFDFSFEAPEGLILFPHFFDRIIPGWLDKGLPWRKAATQRLDNVVMIAPTDEFVASLPRAKVPDRKDFQEMDTTERIRIWRNVVAKSRRLADEWNDLIAGGQWQQRLQPFGA